MARATEPTDQAKDEAATALRSGVVGLPDARMLADERGPAEDLTPWIARLYATRLETSDDHVIDCGLLSDTPTLRVIFSGDWTAETRDGTGRYNNCALFFGPHTKRMPVKVKGPFAVAGVALKPGAVCSLGGPESTQTLDRIILYDHIYGDRSWGNSAQLIEWFDPDGPPERWLKIAEELFRQLVGILGGKPPDPVIEAFDKAAFADPNLSLAEFAEENRVERRTLERMVKKCYGQTPRQVLRRARVLDIAAHLLGVADDREEEEAALRFFDQSHMIREFRAFFDMTPRQFAKLPQPLLTQVLESRQMRRLEVLGRRLPGAEPPWRQ